MPIWINDNGTPRNLQSLFVNDNGTIRDLQKVWINDNGTARLIFSKGGLNPTETTFYEFVIALESTLGTNVLSAGPLSSTTRAEGVAGTWEIILAPGYSFGGTNTVVGTYNSNYTTRYLFTVASDGTSAALASSNKEQFRGGNFTVNYADPDAFSILYTTPSGLAGFPHRATWGNAAGGAVQSNTFLWTIPVTYSTMTVAGIGGGGGGGTGGGFGISNSATGGGGGGGGAFNTGIATTGTTFSIRLGAGGVSYGISWAMGDRGYTGQAGGNTAVNTGSTTLFVLNGGGGGVGGLNTFDTDTVNVGGSGGSGSVNASTGAPGGKGSTGSTGTDFGFNGGNNTALGTTGGFDTGERTQYGSGGGGGGGAGWDNGGNASGLGSTPGSRGSGGGGGNGEGNGREGGDGYVQFTWTTDPIVQTGFSVYSLSTAETRSFTVPLGSPSPTRYTAIALTGKQSGTFSATLGGIPMTVHAMTQWIDRAFSVVLFCDTSSLGSTDTLSITCSGGSVGRNGVAVFRCDGVTTIGAEYSIKDPNTSIPSTIAAPMTQTFSVSNDTFVLAVSASDEYLWSYITGLTNQYGSSIESQAAHAGSWEFFETGQSVTVTNPVNQSGSGGSGSGGERTLSIVTFT